MIPFVASVRIRHKSSWGCRLWIPLALVWLLLLPLVLLLMPVVCIACWVGRVKPLQALSVFWQILCGLNGTEVEVQEGRSSFEIHVF
jgi:hypothetical protein